MIYKSWEESGEMDNLKMSTFTDFFVVELLKKNSINNNNKN